MSLAALLTPAVGFVELALAGLSVSAIGWSGFSYRHDDVVEATVLVGLAVVGAFSLVALDAARRGAGL
ncbi:hypothetical protein [Lichenibacterium dinghuense]|uniref:hypothetical protein n=1 Tax=Lichenibacterium dinghuense TaxID=2895977 RepID=UPI001F3E9733|nr:hypothetical protein [Lichenibacterium sp. 6Y81]